MVNENAYVVELKKHWKVHVGVCLGLYVCGYLAFIIDNVWAFVLVLFFFYIISKRYGEWAVLRAIEKVEVVDDGE